MTMTMNGWDVQAMTEAIDDVRNDPASGRLTWRSRVSWDGGFGLDVRTRSIEQKGDVLERRFTIRGDHPTELLGQNTGPTAIELILAALGSCVAGTYAAQATARKVELDGLEVDVEGDIDLNGFFGLQDIRPAISNVKLVLHVNAEAKDGVLEEILEATRAHSPVFDSVTRPVAVETSIRGNGGARSRGRGT